MNTDQIEARLKALNAALIEKGFIAPNCEFSVYSGEPFTTWVRANVPSETKLGSLLEAAHGDTPVASLDGADLLVAELKSVHDHKKDAAVKQLGRAVDALRDAGIDAEFVNPLADQLKAISQNLLAHRPAS